MPLIENIKNRAIRYLLQKVLGRFLCENLSLEQLSVELFQGTGTVKDLKINVKVLNEELESLNLPFEFVHGYLGKISISIPWTKLRSQACFIECSDLEITVQPKNRGDNGSSMYHSVFSSMTSSMQLAQECLKQEAESNLNVPKPDEKFEGVEQFAHTIDDVVTRIQVKFLNTVIRFQHVPKDSLSAIALEIRIKNLDYFDEGSIETLKRDTEKENVQMNNNPSSSNNQPNVSNKLQYVSKKITCEGITLYSDEFPISSLFKLSPSFEGEDLEQSFQPNECCSKTPTSSPCSTPPPSCVGGNFQNDSGDESKTSNSNDIGANNSNVSEKSDPINCATLSGRQEIRFRIKQAVNVPGPHLEIDFLFGSLFYFITPRQLNGFIHLLQGFIKTNGHSSSSENTSDRDVDLESDKPDPSLSNRGGLQCGQGWSTATLDDNEDENKQTLNESPTSEMEASFSSSVSSASNNSSKHTSGLSSPNNQRSSQPKDESKNQPPKVESNRFIMRLSSIAGVLLHNDILTACVEGSLARSSVQQLKQMALNYFQKLETYKLNGYGNRNFEETKQLFSNACQQNHIRFLVNRLMLEGDTRTNSSPNLMISLGSVEVLECLFDKKSPNTNNISTTLSPSEVEYVDLLKFSKKSEELYAQEADIKLNIKFEDKTKMILGRSCSYSRTEVNVDLQPCISEVDITIVDRISALLNPVPFTKNTTNYFENNSNMKKSLNPNKMNSVESKIEVKISSSNIKVKLRIPSIDLRPVHDMDRPPWWRRTVRKDYFMFDLSDPIIRLLSSSNSNSSPFELTAQKVQGFFYHGETEQNFMILYAVSRESNGIVDLPRISIKKFFKQNKVNGLDSMDESTSQNQEGHSRGNSSQQQFQTFENSNKSNDTFTTSMFMPSLSKKKEPTPFSNKKVIHETDTLHQNNSNSSMAAGEEMIIPGNKAEIAEFKDYSIKNCQLLINIHLARASILMPSKYIFEIIYNRINNDLLLWEPSAPNSDTKEDLNESIYGNESIFGLNNSTPMDDSLGQSANDPMTSSFFQATSSQPVSDEEEEKFYSFYKSSETIAPGLNLPKKKNINKQNKVVVSLTIYKGLITMYTRTKNSSNVIIPGQQGEIRLLFDEGSFFSVSGHKGRKGHGYMSIQVNRIAFYHNALMKNSDSQTPKRILEDILIKGVAGSLGNNMVPVIFNSENGTFIKQHNSSNSLDMLTVAVRILPFKEKQIKSFRVAVGLRDATLRYRMLQRESNWFFQLTDLFDLVDFPVMGYDPPQTLTELHFHLWDCAVDSRPLYIPYKAVLTVGSLSITSNIVAQISTSTLRVFAEECMLFVSEKVKSRNKPVDLRRDYVCVIIMALFEHSFRVCDLNPDIAPIFDLRCAIPRIDIHTCEDSARALSMLLKYFADDGDLHPPVDNITGTNSGPASISGDQNLLVDPLDENVEEINLLSKSQAAHVNKLMAEAMKESIRVKSTDKPAKPSRSRPKKGIEVFYFPDEVLPQTNLENNIQFENMEGFSSGSEFESDNNAEEDDDDWEKEFIFLEKDPLFTAPEIQHLTNEPVKIIDNHFSIPLGRIDSLNAPKHFPPAVECYTLRDMTCVWHMYGGSDFDSSTEPPNPFQSKSNEKESPLEKEKKKTCATSDCSCSSKRRLSSSNNVSYSKKSPNDIHMHTEKENHTKKKPLKTNWIVRGGSRRDHSRYMQIHLNKVRYRYEVFPSSLQYSKRHVLLIDTFEIIDRMESSGKNKFLYLYTSEAHPKKSREMFLFEMLTMRPESEKTSEECSIRVSVLPLQFNIDQDAILFLYNFAKALSKDSQSNENDTGSSSSRHSTPTHQPPILSVNIDKKDDKGDKDVPIEEPLLIQLDEKTVNDNKKTKPRSSSFNEAFSQKSTESNTNAQYSSPYFIKTFTFESEVPIRIDYTGKHVDLTTHGPAAGLLLGLAHLHNSELTLKTIVHRKGILGFDKLIIFIVNEWINDIKINQLGGILCGVGPMHALMQFFQGIRDLVWMPIEQYQKDGRIVRGIQRGAHSFTQSTAMAALELTSRLLTAVQGSLQYKLSSVPLTLTSMTIGCALSGGTLPIGLLTPSFLDLVVYTPLMKVTAEVAHDMISPGPGVRRRLEDGKWRRYNPPSDVREGITNAYLLVKQGMTETANQFYEIASSEHEQKGVTGAVGGVLRQIPGTCVTPIIICAEASNNVLGGMRSQLAPDIRRETFEKFRIQAPNSPLK